jgi:hypothetical protein
MICLFLDPLGAPGYRFRASVTLFGHRFTVRH